MRSLRSSCLELLRRAAELGLPEPRLARDLDRGEYGDLLWRTFTRAELGEEAFEPAWRRHGRGGRRLPPARGSGERRGVLQLWPEGRPSPDGEIGPIQRGLKALVRRGRPQLIQPVGIAYDPLVPRRTHAFVSFGDSFPPPEEEPEAVVLDRLKLAVPLTAGQVVAASFVEGVEPGAAALEEAVAAAQGEGRNAAPDLSPPPAGGAGWPRRSRLRFCAPGRARVPGQGVSECRGPVGRGKPRPRALLARGLWGLAVAAAGTRAARRAERGAPRGW